MKLIFGILLMAAPMSPARADVRFLDRPDSKCILWLSLVDPENKNLRPVKFIIETPRTYIGFTGRNEIGSLLEIYDKTTGHFIGYIDLREEKPGVFELPIVLRAKGEGFGSETKFAVIKYIFERKGAREIIDYVSPQNEVSVKLHKKLGYELKEGAAPQIRDGEMTVPYVITKDRFYKSEPKSDKPSREQLQPQPPQLIF